jgi:hypothetical protein
LRLESPPHLAGAAGAAGALVGSWLVAGLGRNAFTTAAAAAPPSEALCSE